MDTIYLLLGTGFFLFCWALAAYSGKLMEE